MNGLLKIVKCFVIATFQKVFKHQNKFSDHDNRQALCNHGEIFGTVSMT